MGEMVAKKTRKRFLALSGSDSVITYCFHSWRWSLHSSLSYQYIVLDDPWA